MAYTIYDFVNELRPIAVERYRDEEVSKDYIDRDSNRYRNLQRVFGNNTEIIDKLYLQEKNEGRTRQSPF